MYRQKGKNSLSSLLKIESNIQIIEKLIFDSYSTETDYLMVVYQVVGDIIQGSKLSEIVKCLKQNKYGWDHVSFDNERFNLDEQDKFIEHPFEVEEGVVTCKCGCKKVFSYAKQTRGADEPTTTYASCTKCGASWSYSG